MLRGLIYFSYVVRTRQKFHADRTVICSDEGGSGYNLGTSLISVDVELPSTQVLAGVGGLHDLRVTIVGICYRYRSSFTCFHLHGFDATIHNPVVVVGVKLLDIVSTGSQTGHGNKTIRSSFERRSSNCFCASSVGINAEAPTGQILAGICSLLDLQTTCDFLVHSVDRVGHIRRILSQRSRPCGRATGFITRGEHSFGHGINTQGHFARLCIAIGVGGADNERVIGCIIHCSEISTGQCVATGILLVHFNPANAFDLFIDIQVIPCGGRTGLGTSTGHEFCCGNLRAATVADVDNEVGNTTIRTGLRVQIVLACINGYVSKISIRVGENNHVTRNKVRICSCCIGITGNTTACLVRKIFQAGFPRPYRSSRVRTIIHSGRLNGFMYMSRINAFDIRQVVVDEVAYERTTNKALLTELSHVGCSARNRGGICYSFITVHEGRIIVISDTGQNIRCVGLKVTGNILSDIQIAVIF